MKTNFRRWLMMIILAGLIAAGCSSDKHEKIRGTVISVDIEKNTVVIKAAKTGQQQTITLTANDMRKVQPGLRISALLKKGSNIADSVKVKMIKTKNNSKEGSPGDKGSNDQQE
jgi:hypothetical protein